jgi:hypothetical protein
LAIDDYSDSVTREVESRLDDLFGEFESVQEQEALPEAEAITSDPETAAADLLFDEAQPMDLDDPVEQLKATFYSLDWEITDESMNTFFGQILGLKKVYAKEPMIFQNLRLLGAVGKYIRRKKANAHPDSFGLFKTLFECFEFLVSKPSDRSEIKSRFKQEVLKFKKLRQEILRLSGKIGKPARPAPVETFSRPEKTLESGPVEQEDPDDRLDLVEKQVVDAIEQNHSELITDTTGTAKEFEAFEGKMQEMKDFIRAELLKLRDEIVQQVLEKKSRH